MNYVTRMLTHLYAFLLLVYPKSFRAEFGDEMKHVFAEVLREETSRGGTARVTFLLRELRDWMKMLPAQHWRSVRKWGQGRTFSRADESEVFRGASRRYIVSTVRSNDDLGFLGKREAILSALPPLLLGLGIAASAAIVGGPYRNLPEWRVALGIVAALVPAAAVAVGCLVAVIRRLSGWGYTWLGAFLAGAFFLVTAVGDELAESGRNPVSEQLELVIGIAVVLVLLAVLAAVAARGWEKAGLVSIGLSSTLGIALWGAVTWAPFHRYDLALMAAPVGLLVATLIYAYVRGSLATRIVVLLGVCLLNVAAALMAGQVWHEWLAKRGSLSPVIPFIVAMSGLLLAGPIVGLFVQPIRHRLRRA